MNDGLAGQADGSLPTHSLEDLEELLDRGVVFIFILTGLKHQSSALQVRAAAIRIVGAALGAINASVISRIFHLFLHLLADHGPPVAPFTFAAGVGLVGTSFSKSQASFVLVIIIILLLVVVLHSSNFQLLALHGPAVAPEIIAAAIWAVGTAIVKS